MSILVWGTPNYDGSWQHITSDTDLLLVEGVDTATIEPGWIIHQGDEPPPPGILNGEELSVWWHRAGAGR